MNVRLDVFYTRGQAIISAKGRLKIARVEPAVMCRSRAPKGQARASCVAG